MTEKTGAKCWTRLNMHEPAVFFLRVQGRLGQDWADYFGAQSMSVETDADGQAVTILTTEPVDQAGLIGIINHVNLMRLPLVSVECLHGQDSSKKEMKDE